MIAASSCSGSSSAVPAHSAPSPRANALPSAIAGARDREHAPALVRGDLADEVGRGAEPVEAEPLRARRTCAAPGSRSARRRAAAPPRSGVGGQRQAEALVGDDQLGVAAVAGVAGEERPRAEVLAPGAVAALAAGPAEPRDPDPVAGREALRPVPDPTTSPTTWWPRTSGSFGSASSPSTMCRSVRQTPQAITRDEHLAAPRLGIGDLGLHERLPGRSRTIARTRASVGLDDLVERRPLRRGAAAAPRRVDQVRRARAGPRAGSPPCARCSPPSASRRGR